MQVSQPFPINVIDLQNSMVLVWPSQADTTKGKNWWSKAYYFQWQDIIKGGAAREETWWQIVSESNIEVIHIWEVIRKFKIRTGRWIAGQPSQTGLSTRSDRVYAMAAENF